MLFGIAHVFLLPAYIVCSNVGNLVCTALPQHCGLLLSLPNAPSKTSKAGYKTNKIIHIAKKNYLNSWNFTIFWTYLAICTSVFLHYSLSRQACLPCNVCLLCFFHMCVWFIRFGCVHPCFVDAPKSLPFFFSCIPPCTLASNFSMINEPYTLLYFLEPPTYREWCYTNLMIHS
jgi:hypothetical protein